MIEIVAVNRTGRFALTDRGDICPIRNFFGAYGEETDDPDWAISAVAELDAENWFSIDLTQFEPVTVN